LETALHFSLAQGEHGENNMRRLVAISSKSTKAIMVLVALAVSLTSIHMVAAARIASLQREQEQLEHTKLVNVPSALSQAGSIGTADWRNNADVAKQRASGVALDPGSGPELPGPAATPGVAASRRRIVISIADRKLAVMEDGHLLKTYVIAVGTRSAPSPDGEFVIINHAKDPTYRHGDKEIPPGKDNPLGSRWMGLSLKGYGIHGTNVQSSVGKASSHGCFRMRRRDVEELYTLVQVGDAVTVRRERDAMIAQVFAGPEAPAAFEAKAGNGNQIQVATAAVAPVEATQQ
jgi:lipoprotein-anchoring transpeptidase ErfK/SrfK